MYYIFSFLLSLLYIGYYIVTQFLLKHFTIGEIILNSYFVTFIFVLIFFNKDLTNSIKNIKNNINYKYLAFLLIGIILVITNFLSVSACKSEYNFGLIDSMASSLYLPIVTFISFYYFKTKVTKKNMLGVLFACISIYLLS